MIRVLFIDQNDFSGGGQFQISNLMERMLKYNNFTLSLLFSNQNKVYKKYVNNNKINTIIFKKDRRLLKKKYIYNIIVFISMLFLLNKILRKYKIHIIYAASSMSALASVLIKIIFPIKIIHTRMHAQSPNKLTKVLLKIIFKNVNGLVYNSVYTKNIHKEIFGTNNKIPNIISYSIVENPIKFLSTNTKEHMFTMDLKKENDVIIGCIGRISPVKNIHYFIEVAKQMCHINNNLKLKFIIVGDEDPRFPNYYKEIKELTDSLGTENISLIDYKENVYDIISSLDLIIQLSEGEAFGRVVLETALLNVPILVKSPGGSDEIISYYEKGRLCFNYNINDISMTAFDLISLEKNKKSNNTLLDIFNPETLVKKETGFMRRILFPNRVNIV